MLNNVTNKETIESLQRLIRELKKYPEDATVTTLAYSNGGYSNIWDLADWKIGDVTRNSIDILF